LIFVSETLRMVPGSQYFGDPEELQGGFSTMSGVGVFNDISTELTRAVEAASDKNVRIYTVYAGGLNPDVDTTNPLVMLASETGGVAVHGTNRLGMVFERAEEDLSCSYRIGFRIPVAHSGKVLPITVRVGNEGRGYRVRYRRTLSDPTRGEEE